MTRIIGGTAGGRRLDTPPGDNTRPTSDRVREALFSALESWAGTLRGLAVLDLYAGSGALGLEASSRGAVRVTSIEHDRATAALIRRNADSIGAQGVTVVTGSVPTVLARGTSVAYDVVFCDPPYLITDEALDADMALLVEHGWLAADGLVVVERSKRSNAPQWPVGIEAGRVKKYGETKIFYAHGVPAPDADQHLDDPSDQPQDEENS